MAVGTKVKTFAQERSQPLERTDRPANPHSQATPRIAPQYPAFAFAALLMRLLRLPRLDIPPVPSLQHYPTAQQQLCSSSNRSNRHCYPRPTLPIRASVNSDYGVCHLIRLRRCPAGLVLGSSVPGHASSAHASPMRILTQMLTRILTGFEGRNSLN